MKTADGVTLVATRLPSGERVYLDTVTGRVVYTMTFDGYADEIPHLALRREVLDYIGLNREPEAEA